MDGCKYARACICVSIHAMHAWVWTDGRMDGWMDVCTHVGMEGCVPGCVQCMHACACSHTYARVFMYVLAHVCICALCMHACRHVRM
jgi:hypothetical protein